MHQERAARLSGCARLGATLLVPGLAVASSLPARGGDDVTQFAMTPDQRSVAKALNRGTGDAAFDALPLDLSSLPPLKIGDGLALFQILLDG